MQLHLMPFCLEVYHTPLTPLFNLILWLFCSLVSLLLFLHQVVESDRSQQDISTEFVAETNH